MLSRIQCNLQGMHIIKLITTLKKKDCVEHVTLFFLFYWESPCHAKVPFDRIKIICILPRGG